MAPPATKCSNRQGMRIDVHNVPHIATYGLAADSVAVLYYII
jgi:hypothetical protein